MPNSVQTAQPATRAARNGAGASVPSLTARLAVTAVDRRAALALRHAIFVGEMGASMTAGPGTECDGFDDHAAHLILEDRSLRDGPRIVGTSRVLAETEAGAAGGFCSEAEFDIAPLRRGNRRLIEVGRTCLHRDYRGGAAMVVLWRALAAIALARRADLLFGTASFPGTDPSRHRPALDLLHRDHLAPEALRVRSRQGGWAVDDAAPRDGVDGRLQAMKETPALIKSYLRLGGAIGDGVFVDDRFNTVDVCLVLDVARLSARGARLYGAEAPAFG